MAIGQSVEIPAARGASARRLLSRSLSSAWFQPALVFLVGLLTLYRFTNAAWTSTNGDSFTMQYDSLRLLHGAVPYRDFFAFPGPGTFYLQALVYAIFGAKAINATYLLVVTLAATGAGLYLLAFWISDRRIVSWFAPLFLFFGLAPHFAYPYHHWYAVAMATLTMLVMARWLQRPNRWLLMLAGATCAVTGFFVQTQGIALTLAIVAFLVLQAARETAGPRALPRAFSLRLLWLGAGVVAAVSPVVLYFALVGGLRSYIYDTLIWPPRHYGCRHDGCLNNYPLMSDLFLWVFWKFPREQWITAIPMRAYPLRFYSGLWVTFGAILVPFIALICSARFVLADTWSVIRRWWQNRTERTLYVPTGTFAGELLLLCCIVNITLFAVFMSGVNLAILHMMWFTLLTYPTLLGFIFLARHEGERMRDEASPYRSSGIPYVNLVLASLVLAAGIWYGIYSTPGSVTDVDAIGRARPINTYIHEHTSADDTIAVFPDGGLTYFYGRPAAIGYTLMLPQEGFHTTAQYRETANQIESNRPKLIIFQPNNDWNLWTGFPEDLFQFVRDNYTDGQGQPGAPYRLQTDKEMYLIYIRR